METDDTTDIQACFQAEVMGQDLRVDTACEERLALLIHELAAVSSDEAR